MSARNPTAFAVLATATIAVPRDASIPPELERALAFACAGAWRALEAVLAGDVLRARVSRTVDDRVRTGVEALFALFPATPLRADALAALRHARQGGALDGALDVEVLVASCEPAASAPVMATRAITELRNALQDRPLDRVLAEPLLAELLVDAARALFRHAARLAPVLEPWAIASAGHPARDHAFSAFAELVAASASLAELEVLIAMPLHLDENVQFTVYRPRSVDPGRWHPLLAFAHLSERRPDDDAAPDPIEEVRRQAESMLGDRAKGYQPITQDSASAVPLDGELTFVPEIAGVEFNPPRRSFIWLEPVHREEFRMRAGAALDGKTARGRLTVFLGHIAIAEVPLAVRVDARAPEPAVREPAHARAYRKIFASYSHRDIAIVNQFETYARALGDEYLRDWIHLRTGEVWNDRLRQLIENADAFQLFWSWNAMGSKFVRQEYEHALALNRPSFVRPTYWEDPMPTAPGQPPEALLRLHFQKIGGATPLARSEAAIVPIEPYEAPEAPDDPTLDDVAPAPSASYDFDAADSSITPPRPRARSASSSPAAGSGRPSPPSESRPPRPNEHSPLPPMQMDREADFDDYEPTQPRHQLEMERGRASSDPTIANRPKQKADKADAKVEKKERADVDRAADDAKLVNDDWDETTPARPSPLSEASDEGPRSYNYGSSGRSAGTMPPPSSVRPPSAPASSAPRAATPSASPPAAAASRAPAPSAPASATPRPAPSASGPSASQPKPVIAPASPRRPLPARPSSPAPRPSPAPMPSAQELAAISAAAPPKPDDSVTAPPFLEPEDRPARLPSTLPQSPPPMPPPPSAVSPFGPTMPQQVYKARHAEPASVADTVEAVGRPAPMPSAPRSRLPLIAIAIALVIAAVVIFLILH